MTAGRGDGFSQWRAGLRDGIPIGLGYLAVSFAFGIAATGMGLAPLCSVLMSALNLTSAGQFAALSVIAAGGTLAEMAATQLVINLRYSLMSCALSQKIDPKTTLPHRLIMAFGVTDEVFGVSAGAAGRLSPFYSYGLMSAAIPGWVAGTLLGAVLGGVLPARLINALSVSLYGMFIAIIVPPSREKPLLAGIVLLSMAASFAAGAAPLLQGIPFGFRIIILTVIIAGAAAALFPVEEARADE